MDHSKLCFFVTFDEKNIPVNFDYRGWYPENSQYIDSAFMYYILQWRNDVKTDSFFPDLRICRYDIPDTPAIGSQLNECNNDNQKFRRFVEEHLLQPVCDFSLRKYDALLDAWGGKAMIETLDDLKHYMDPATSMDKQIKEKIDLSLQYWCEIDQSRENQHLKAIETRQGTLLLPQSSMIEKRHKAILQYIADKFFMPEGQQLGYVREYTIYSPSKEQQGFAEKSAFMFSPRNMMFIPQMATWYRPIESPKERTNGCQYDIQLKYDAFRYFTEDNYLQIEGYNQTISDLLFIAEFGTPKGFQTEPQFKDFIYRDLFRDLDDALAKLPTKSPQNDHLFFEIQNKQKYLARAILKKDCEINLPKEVVSLQQNDKVVPKSVRTQHRLQNKRKYNHYKR